MALFNLFRRADPEDAFAERLMRRLSERGWPYPLRYDRQRFEIDTGGDTGVLYLGNIFSDWARYPKREQAAQLDRAVGLVFDLQPDEQIDEIIASLLPVVRNLTHLQAIALGAEVAPSLDPWQPYRLLAGPLATVLAVDRPHSLALVPADKLQTWGWSFDEAMDRAMANLVARSSVQFERQDRGFYISNYDDGYDSSRILMPELFRGLPLRGAPVAVVAARNCVAVAGSDDTDALNAMAAFVVETIAQETRPIAYSPLILDGERWRRFEPPSVELAALADLNVRQAIWDYGTQTPLLESYFQEKGEDVFVAPLEVLADGDVARTWTSWTEHVPARLPRADALGLTDQAGRTLVRLWADVEAVCGPFEADEAFHPTRLTPPAWPTGERWIRLEREFPTPPGCAKT